MAIARIDSITADAEHPASLARFWAAALEGYSVRDYDEAEIQRLAALDLTPETDPTVMVDGPGPTLCFQKMPDRASARNRWHLDLVGASREVEVERLCALGARVRDVHDGWTTLLDPEGNPFCVLDPEPGPGTRVPGPSDGDTMAENSTRPAACAPVFVVHDIAASVAYYRDILGFDVSFTYGEPTFYAGVYRGSVTIHLQAANQTQRPAGNSSLYLFVGSADEIHRELVERGARVLENPATYPYGMREFDVADLDGNRLIFGCPEPAPSGSQTEYG